jgi:hypothetical protein
VADTSGLITALHRLTEEPTPPRGPQCTVKAILDQLDPITGRKLYDLLKSPAVSATQIADALTDNGYPVRAPAVARHRRRGRSNGCRCPR